MNSNTLLKGIKKPWKVPPYVINSIRNKYYSYKNKYYSYKWNLITVENSEIKTTVNDWEMFLHPNDEDISKNLYFSGDYDDKSIAYINNNINPGDNVVDIGAQIGYFTLHMASQVGGSGRVYSFEPHPDNFDMLNKNVEANGYAERVNTHNIALYDEKAELELYLHPTNKGMHSLGNKRSDESISVRTIEGDKILNEKTDLIKIDVEGAESEVISGLSETIQNNQPDMIFEYDKSLLDGEGDDYLHMLENYGYKFRLTSNNSKQNNLTASDIISKIDRANIIAEVE